MTISDARDAGRTSTLAGDVCIVGGGVAGITLATELAASSARVVLLESGGLEFTRSLRSLPSGLRHHLRGAQQLAAGHNIGLPYYPLRFARARALGGSSRAWTAHGLQAAPLDEIDFAHRPHLPHHGWPFDREHLEPYYRCAQDLCNLGPFDYDVGAWQARGLGRPLPLDDHRIRSTMFQFGLASAFDRFAPALAAAPNVHVVTHATATALLSSPAGHVARVAGATLERARIVVDADVVVLAAGAIDNARLLLTSTATDPRGLGNEHDLVGRHFMEHPDIEVGLLISDPDVTPDQFSLYTVQQVRADLKAHAMLRLSDEVLASEGLLNSVTRLRPVGPSEASVAARSSRIVRRSVHLAVPTRGLLSHAGSALRRPQTLLDRRTRRPTIYRLDIMSEQGPNPRSRVALGRRRDRFGVPRAVLDWRLDERDWRSIRRAAEIVGEGLEKAGIGTVVSTLDGQPGPPAVFGNWHHLGTTRMHTDPTRGVVDDHCRVHGVDNLYVAGGSVFPTGGYANPTLTITALALRLSEHLGAT